MTKEEFTKEFADKQKELVKPFLEEVEKEMRCSHRFYIDIGLSWRWETIEKEFYEQLQIKYSFLDFYFRMYGDLLEIQWYEKQEKKKKKRRDK